jgi:hypothetical protein
MELTSFGDQYQAGTQTTFGLYAQDIGVRPNLTLSFGVRWQPQDAFANKHWELFVCKRICQVHGLSGEAIFSCPERLQDQHRRSTFFPIGATVYNPDKNNFGPSVGAVES